LFVLQYDLNMSPSLTIKSALLLSSGYKIPVLGFGVYQNYDTKNSVLLALEAGYRHIDCAQAYRNEQAVGQAVAASNLNREEIFYSQSILFST
jgi:diketogulonate reductase-like aldo/keto reductase